MSGAVKAWRVSSLWANALLAAMHDALELCARRLAERHEERAALALAPGARATEPLELGHQ